jgi:exodeoxyribonuclease VII large subunit
MRQWILEGRARAVLCEEKMSGLIRRKIQNLKGLWEKLSVEMDSLSPLNILKKGYTLCWKDKNQGLIRKVDEVMESDKIAVSFLKGELSCIVRAVDRRKKIESRLSKNKKR